MYGAFALEEGCKIRRKEISPTFDHCQEPLISYSAGFRILPLHGKGDGLDPRSDGYVIRPVRRSALHRFLDTAQYELRPNLRLKGFMTMNRD